MKFHEATTFLAGGFRMRRREWQHKARKPMYIALGKGQGYAIFDDDHDEYRFDGMDVFANDWERADEPARARH